MSILFHSVIVKYNINMIISSLISFSVSDDFIVSIINRYIWKYLRVSVSNCWLTIADAVAENYPYDNSILNYEVIMDQFIFILLSSLISSVKFQY